MFLSTVMVSQLFDHHRNAYQLSNFSNTQFADFDGDGVKDYKDCYPKDKAKAQLCDGKVVINHTNQPPTIKSHVLSVKAGKTVTLDLLKGANDPENDLLFVTPVSLVKGVNYSYSIIAGKLKFSAKPGFSSGSGIVIAYEVTDKMNTVKGIITVKKEAGTDPVISTPPKIINHLLEVQPGQRFSLNLLTGSSDLENDLLFVIDQAKVDGNGFSYFITNNKLQFIPRSGFLNNPQTVINYAVTDGVNTVQGTVTIKLQNINLVPLLFLLFQ